MIIPDDLKNGIANGLKRNEFVFVILNDTCNVIDSIRFFLSGIIVIRGFLLQIFCPYGTKRFSLIAVEPRKSVLYRYRIMSGVGFC